MNLAVKDIRHNKGRFLLTGVGIGMLLMIVMGMLGIYRGLIQDATLLIERIGADLWVVQLHTRGPFAEVSRVPRNLVERLAAVPGVLQAREFVYHTIQREKDGRPLRMGVLGVSWPADQGQWLPLVAGRPLLQAHFEMIADQKLGLRLGERLKLGKETFTVVGITRGMVTSGGDGLAVFSIKDAQAIQFDAPSEAVRLERAARRARTSATDIGATQPLILERAAGVSAAIPALGPPMVSAVIASLSAGTDPGVVKTILSGWNDVSVFSRDDQKDLMLEGAVEMAKRQIGLFTLLLSVISAIIMALILYTLTMEKVHSIALLKLIGARNRVILTLILQQALLLGAIGYALAFILGQQLFPKFPRRVIVLPEDLALLAVVVAVTSVVSSLLGIWKAMRVDPNEALSG